MLLSKARLVNPNNLFKPDTAHAFPHRRRGRLAVMWVLPWNARDLETLCLEELVDVPP